MVRVISLSLIIIVAFKTTYEAVFKLQPNYPIEIFKIKPNSIEIYNTYFGIWWKYLPLSNTTQIGNIGLLDSNCFHFLHAKESITERINFLYYLCLDYEIKTVYTYLQFIDNTGLDHFYKIQINEELLESIWQYIGFCLIPSENRFTIFYKFSGQLTKSFEVLIKFPFYDVSLNLIYGGGLKVNDNQKLQTSLNKKLAYFPGEILRDEYVSAINICKLSNSQMPINNINGCLCSENNNSTIVDSIIEKEQQFFFISEYSNCDGFFLSGWIKIDETLIFENEFYYKLIKLSGNFIQQQLIDDNLSAFTLTYKIGQNGNQIIVTTYSYIFPLVNIDFSKDPNLIKHIFDVNTDIKRWHYLIAWKQESTIYFSITFYDKFNIEKLEFNQQVKQFGSIKFQLHIGNILQSSQQYLKINLIGFQFFNCPQIFDQIQNCHPTCKECDGPTQYDCLSCFESSNRIYVPNFNQCICKYGTMDQDNFCINHKSINLIILPDEGTNNKCKYGYYEKDGTCQRCPSTISDNVITCLECLYNTNDWINNLICKTSLQTDNEGNIYEKQEISINFNFPAPDESQLDICLFGCDSQEIEITPIPSDLIIPHFICSEPDFINFEQKCTSCPIKQCLYCFSYFATDLSKTTLDYNFNYSTIGEEIKIGCAQCLNGFIYSFELEQCIFKNPSNPNCLRSYVQQDGQEICTLSAIDDFSIAPAIINCQQRILNCKQCFQTPELILKCQICEDGYAALSSTGICSVCNKLNTKSCLELNAKEKEPWKWYIQDFRIKFLHLKNFDKTYVVRYAIFSMECKDGYQVIDQNCYKYCDDNCQICKKIFYFGWYFSCQKCDTNYYKIPNRVQIDGKCIECPPLCQICEQRSIEEIKQINPYFILTPENTIYSYKCLKKNPLPRATIDQYSQFAYFCFNDDCNQLFEYQVNKSCEGQSSVYNFNDIKHYQYFNSIGLKEITLILPFNLICPIKKQENFQIVNYFKEKVFSMQLVKLRIEAEFQSLIYDTQLKILYFDTILIKKVKFLLQKLFELIIDNRVQSINLMITDTSFYSNQSTPIKLQIYGGNFFNFQLSNIHIFDMNIQNSIIFQITSQDLGESIKINNLQISNCKLNNTTLLFFSNLSRKIIIDNLIIKSCQFYTSQVIQSNISLNNFAYITINNIDIQNSSFLESSFIYSYGNSDIKITKFQLINCQISASRFISFSKNFYFSDILLEDNLIQETQLLIQLQSNERNSKIGIENFMILKNKIINSAVVITGQSLEQNEVYFQFQNFKFEDNIQDSQENYKYLFQINCYNILIKDFILKSTINFKFFSLISTPYITFENIIYENQFQKEKVAFKFDCYQSSAIKSQLLSVQGFQRINLEQIKILNQFSIDLSIISIQSNSKIILNTIEYVIIRNISFIGNILLKQNQTMYFSLIDIYSEITEIITLENIIYQYNIFHQYQIDPSQNSASLMQINAGQSNLSLKNIISSHNVLTNSSITFISISIHELYIQDFQIINHNYLDADLWNQYYYLQIQSELTQSQIISIINNTFKIESISGVLSIKTSKLNFINGFFSNIIASSSLIFNINLQGDGIVIIKNCYIENAQSQLISTSQVDGAITIDAKKSLLSLEIENLNLKYIQNRISSSIFSIYPSSIKNNIQLKQIYAYNCFSLYNQFISLEFNFNNPQKNQFSIYNLHIIQSENEFINYLQSLGKVSILEIQNILENNAIIHLTGGQFSLKGIIIEGLVLSSIIKIIDYQQIKITDSQFFNVSTFYPLHLLEFSQINELQSILIMNNISIRNVNSFQVNKYQLNYSYNNLNIRYINQCALISEFVKVINEGLESTNNFFDQIQQNSQQKGSLIYFRSITNQTKMMIRKILIENNDCQNCWNGLMSFDLAEIKFIKINEISCIRNFIKRHGCILAISEKNLDREIKIKNLNFISNNGTKGTGVQVQNLRISMQNSRIINNFAFDRGGGIYFNLNSNRFLLNQTIICQNSAQEGGGIFLQGNSSLNQENFLKSLNLYNSATLSSNNINELPSHLGLQINYQEMHSIEQKIDNQSIYTLVLNPYNILSQNKIQRTNYLTLPSGQDLSNFQLFNPKILKYISFLKEISIIFKNSMNEKQQNFLNSTCNVTQNVFDIQSQQILKTNQLQSISFSAETNSFNLNQIQFNFDPYSQNDKILELMIGCKTEYLEKIFFYKMRVNIFLCQLGEFYIQDICLKCQSDQGFYSVTYNATKCSIFDKNKFEAITSNLIQLKPGYWRPNYISDNIELCYKNTNQCLGGWSVGDETCNIEYIGGLCEECDKFNIKGNGQFFKNQQQFVCSECQELSKRLFAFLLLSIWVMLSTFLTIKSVEKSNFLITQLKLGQKFADILFNLSQDHVSILLKLYLNYLWIFSLILSFNINFSFSFSFIKQSTDTSFFMANFFDCFLSEIEGIELIYSRIIVTFCLLFCQIIIIQTGSLLLQCLISYKHRSRIISITVLNLYIQNYASMITQFFSILAVRVISQVSYIQGDVSLLYGTNTHYKWIFRFILPVLTLIGLILPLSLFIFLYSKKQQLNCLKYKRHFGHLFNEYTQNNYFWEWIRLWNKTIIIIILINFETQILLKASLLGFCLQIYQFFTEKFKPYLLNRFNSLDLKTTQLCSCSIFLAAIKYTCDQSYNYSISAILQMIILLISLKLSYPFVSVILHAYYKRFKPNILELLIAIIYSYRKNSKSIKYLRQKLIQIRQQENNIRQNFLRLRLAVKKQKSHGNKNSNIKIHSNKSKNSVAIDIKSKFEKQI
ncbi:unnamed protein product [Paramecium pentaurelia]|uniref:Transmembrane protein n=1 Tax=Paramecium pentaurelia TaxID=43138 RepID=A0A8S1VSQ0_9CILI|nr:unnamed protein product [Paramecium pentaurelia]